VRHLHSHRRLTWCENSGNHSPNRMV